MPLGMEVGLCSGDFVLDGDTLLVGINQTLRRGTEGANYIRQGGHHVGHWPTFLVSFYDGTTPQIKIGRSTDGGGSGMKFFKIILF